MRHAVFAAALVALLAALSPAWADEDEEPGPQPADAPGPEADEDASEEQDEEGSGRPRTAALVEVVADLKGHSGRLVRALAFSPDGKILATSGSDRSLRLWYVGVAKAKAAATVPPSD